MLYSFQCTIVASENVQASTGPSSYDNFYCRGQETTVKVLLVSKNIHSNSSLGNQGYKKKWVCDSMRPLLGNLSHLVSMIPHLAERCDSASSFLELASIQNLCPASLKFLYVSLFSVYNFPINRHMSFWRIVCRICHVYTCFNIGGSLLSLPFK